jgi:MFS-type transporter involved in bile tolerance (Atg22 family)
LLLAYVFAISKLNLGFYIAWAVAGLMALLFLPVVFGVKEPRRLPGVVKHQRYSFAQYWRGLTDDPQVLRYFLAMFILTAGISAITPFIAIYAVKALHFSDDAAILAPLVILLSTALFVWPFGTLADRVGLKRTFTIGIVLMATAAIAGIFVRDHTVFYAVLALAGVGNAAQISAAYPMLTRIANPDQMGLYTGILYGVTSIVGPGMGVIAGVLLDRFGAQALFPLVAALFCASLIPLAFLQLEKSKAAIALAELKARQAQAAA